VEPPAGTFQEDEMSEPRTADSLDEIAERESLKNVFEVWADDFELKALGFCVQIFERLSLDEKRRIVHYLCSKYELS
jgi:hypothetical protein